MFLDKFPSTTFEIKKNELILVTDFIRAVSIDPSLKNDDTLFTTYITKDGETPEQLSYKFYKTTQYHWLIMLLNEKFDNINDFPQPDNRIRAHTLQKYGSLTTIHHYINAAGTIVDAFDPLKIPVTVYEYETTLNETKREVKIMRVEILSEFIQQYQDRINVITE